MIFPRLVLQSGSLASPREFIVRPFVGSFSGRDEDMPFVAIAEGHEAAAFKLARRGVQDAATVRALVAHAQANTEKTVCNWATIETSGFLWFRKPAMLRAHGDIAGESDVRALATDGGGIDDLSSDFMLVRAVMLAAGRILGSEQVVAVAPKRGWLLVRSGRPGDLRAALPLLQAADGVAGRAGEHALSRMAFHFTQGESVGVTVRHGNSGYVSLIRSKEDEWLGGAA